MDDGIYRVENIDGEALDAICFRVYGEIKDYWNAVIDANPEILSGGDLIAFGTVLKLPRIEKNKEKKKIKLWE